MKEINKRIVFGNKYAVAFDYELDSGDIISKFRGANSLIGIQELISKDTSCNSYYQMNKSDKCKIFMDFDKLHLETREECDNLIQKVIDSINEVYNVNITIGDLVIDYYWDTRENKITTGRDKEINSLHIICKSFYTDRILMKRFIQYFKQTYGYEMDDIYCVKKNATRQFRLRNMWKLKATEKEKLISYNNDNHTFKDCWIDYTDNIDYVDMKEEYKEKVIEVSSEIDKEIMKNRPIKNVDILDSETLREIMYDFDKEFYKSKDWKSIYLMINKLVLCDTNKLKNDIIVEFLSFSAENSDKFSLEDNLEYHNKYSEILPSGYDWIKTAGINYFIKTANKYLQSYKLVKDFTDKNLLNESNVWVSNITGISKNTIYNLMSSWDSEENDFIDLDNDNIWKYDMKNCLLINNETEDIYNFNEVLYERQIIEEENNIDWNYVIDNENPYDRKETPKQLQEINDKFVKNTNIDLYGKSKWGSGKSFKCMKPIISEKIKNDKKYSVLIITENNTLNKELHNDLQKYGFVSHLTDKNNLCDYNRIICSMESLKKIKERDEYKRFKLVVFDEHETLCGHIESDTIKDNYKNDFKSAVNIVRYYLETAEQIICLDADLSLERMNIIKQLRKNECITYYYRFNPYLDYTFNHYIYSNDKWNRDWTNDIKNDKRLVFSFTSKTLGDTYERTIKQVCIANKKEYNILYVNGMGGFLSKIKKVGNEYSVVDNLKYMYCGEETNKTNNNDMKKQILEDIDRFIKENNVGILMYSPTFKTGISIRIENYFNKHYSFGKSGSVNVRTYLQMLFRVRDLIGESIDNPVNQFNIYIGGMFGYCKKHINTTRMGEYLSNIAIIHKKEYHLIGRFSLQDTDKEHFKKDNIDRDKNYYDWRVLNFTENYNSDCMFNQLFIEKLKLNHKLNHKYIDGNCGDCNTSEIVKDMKKLEMKDRINMLERTKLITHEEYCEIKKKIIDNKKNDNIQISQEEYDEYNKYKLIKSFYHNNNDDCKSNEEYFIKYLKEYYDTLNILNQFDITSNSLISPYVRVLKDYSLDNSVREQIKEHIKIVNDIIGEVVYYNDKIRIDYEEENCDKEVDLLEYLMNGTEKKLLYKDNWTSEIIENQFNSIGEIYRNTETGEIRATAYKSWVDRYIVGREIYNKILMKCNKYKEKYDLIDSYCYYEKWSKTDKRKLHRNLLKILNPYQKENEMKLVGFAIDDDNDNNNDNVSVCSSNDSLETDYKKNEKEHIYQSYITEIMKIFGIDLEEDKIEMSNKNWWKTLHNNMNKILELESDFTEFLTIHKIDRISNHDIRQYNIDYDKENKIVDKLVKDNKKFRDSVKNIKNIINSHLVYINREIVNLDKNTYISNGRMCIRTKPNYKFNHKNNQESNENITEIGESLLVNECDIHTNKKTGKKTYNRKNVYEMNNKNRQNEIVRTFYYNRKLNTKLINKIKKMRVDNTELENEYSVMYWEMIDKYENAEVKWVKKIVNDKEIWVVEDKKEKEDFKSKLGDFLQANKDKIICKVYDKCNPYINKNEDRKNYQYSQMEEEMIDSMLCRYYMDLENTNDNIDMDTIVNEIMCKCRFDMTIQRILKSLVGKKLFLGEKWKYRIC